MENLDLPLTLEDRDEWGDAVGNVKHRQLLASYCPLQNITPQVCTQKNTNLFLLYVLFVHLFACRARSKTDLKNYGNLKCRFPLQHFFFCVTALSIHAANNLQGGSQNSPCWCPQIHRSAEKSHRHTH